MSDQTSPPGTILSVQDQGEGRSAKVLFRHDGKEQPHTYRVWPTDQDGNPNAIYDALKRRINQTCQMHYYEREGEYNGKPYVSKIVTGIASGSSDPTDSSYMPTGLGDSAKEVLRSAALLGAAALHKGDISPSKVIGTANIFYAWLTLGGEVVEKVPETVSEAVPPSAEEPPPEIYDDEPF